MVSEARVPGRPVVVADTGPIRYLFLIGQVGLFPALFRQIHIPSEVYGELVHLGAPLSLRTWALARPNWMIVDSAIQSLPWNSASLDYGERAAIALACQISAELVLMDDRKGVRFAEGMGFEVVGTLGILDLAARRGYIDLGEAFDRLKATNFRYKPEMLANMLDQDRERRS